MYFFATDFTITTKIKPITETNTNGSARSKINNQERKLPIVEYGTDIASETQRRIIDDEFAVTENETITNTNKYSF